MTQNQQFQPELPENEALFRSVIEGLAEGVIIVDLEEVALYCNDRICEMTGYTREEIISERCYGLVATPEQGQEMLRLNEQRKQGLGDRFEMLSHKKSGTPIWMEIHVNLYRNTLGEVIGTLSACSDITRRKQAETALHKLNEELESRVQERTVQLEAQNRLLLARDRILEATASAANALLTLENFDEAVNTALQIIGESLDTDRIMVIENFDGVSDPLAVGWRVLYEWDSPHAISQISHSDLAQGSYEGVEEWYEFLSRGQSISCLLEDMPEPFRSGQAELGLKALHVVPIFVEGKFWGHVGFDDCHEAKRRSSAELAVLEIAADCIGSAIQRDHIQKAIFQAEQARSQELERHNTELQQALARLTESEQRYSQIMEIVGEGIFRVEYAQPIPVNLPVEEQVNLIYQHFRIAEHNLAFAEMYGYDQPNAMVNARLTDWHIANAPENAVQMEQLVHNGHQMRNQETVEFDRFGCKRHFLNNGFSIIQNGYIIGGWGTQIDITQLRQTQQALMLAEQARSAELAKANEALKRSLDTLATEPELDKFLGYVLTEIVRQTEACAAYLFLYSPEANTLSLCTVFKDGKLYFEPAPGDPQMFQQPFDADITPAWQSLLVERTICLQTIATQNEWTWEETKAWHITQKHSAHAGIALVAGDQPVGFLGIAWQDKTTLTTEQTELVHALSNQATLAIQLTRLAEEAKQVALAKLNEVIAREQEKAATERAAELSKANHALQATIDILGTLDNLDDFVPAALKIISRTFGTNSCAFYEHSVDNFIYLRYWALENHILHPKDLLELDQEKFAFVRRLAEGAEVPIAYVGDVPLRARKHTLILNHATGTAVPEFDTFTQIHGWELELNLPLVINGVAEAALCIYRSAAKPFTPNEIALAEALGKQLALALQSSRLAEEAKLAAIAREQEKAATERAAELAKTNDALKRSLDSLASEPSLDKFLGQVLTAIADQLQSPLTEYWYHPEGDIAYIGMMHWQGRVYDREEITAQFPRHPGVDGFHVFPELIHGESLHHRKRYFIVEDWHTHPFIDDAPWREDWEEIFGIIEKEINVPMMLGDNCIGALVVRMSREQQITTQQIELAQALAHQATLAAQLTRLAEEAKLAAIAREQEKAAIERAAELAKANEALKRSLTMLADEPSLDNFLGYVLQTIADQLGDRSGAVYLYSEPHNTTLLHLNYENGHLQQGDQITHPAVTLPHPPQDWDAQYLPLLRQNQLLIHHACEFDSPAYAPYRQHNLERGIQTLLIVPMLFGDQLLGSLTLRSTQPRNYTPEELELARALAQQATLAVQLTQMAEQRRQQAIAREQEKAALERADELAKANLALQRSVENISQDSSLEKLLSHVLVEAVNLSSACGGGLFVRRSPATGFRPIAIIENGVLRSGEDWLAQGGIERFVERSATDETGFFKQLTQGKINYLRVDEPDELWWADLIAYHQQFGYRVVMHIPMMLHGKVLGLFALCFKQVIEPKPEIIQYLTTLANQATLALELTRLAEQAKEEAQQSAVLEERNRIAREIHDTLAQGFTGVIVQLEATKRKISSTQLEAAQTHITRARSLAAEGLSEARRSVQALRPEALESRNLPDALCHLAEQMTCAPATQVIVQIEGNPYDLPVAVETNLLRIAQEAVTNALRHAQAQTIRLELRFETAAVHLHITDDGQGFDLKSQLMNTSFGLIGMQERSQRLGGQFTLNSNVGQGTEVTVTVPI